MPASFVPFRDGNWLFPAAALKPPVADTACHQSDLRLSHPGAAQPHPRADEQPRTLMPIIETKDLRRTFKGRGKGGEVEAVRGVDLRVEEGQIFGFLGPNGAGKTTTLRM